MRFLIYVSIIFNFQFSIFNLAHAQQRDRLAELNPMTRNPFVTYTSVAPDGSLWMVTHCDEIFRADDIHSPWKILQEGELGGRSWDGENYENIIAFDRNTAVIVGYMWGEYFKRTTTKGLLWDSVKYVSNKQGPEWFHPVWRGEGGLLWAGSQDGFLTFSADSGRTFTTLRDTAFDHKTGIDKIYMTSAKNGFIGCHDNSLYATTDNWCTYRRLPTPFDQKVITQNDVVGCVRQWKNYLIIKQGGESFYTPSPLRGTPPILGGEQKRKAGSSDGQWKGEREIKWKRTPVTLRYFEVDPASGRLWGIDDNHRVVMTEDLERWKPMGVNALFPIGIYDGRLYCRIEEGVMRVGADGVVDSCPFLTTERPIEEPKTTLAQGSLLWGHDGKSIYILDSKGWYRVARVPDIWGMTPDPDREDRVIIMNDKKENYSVDTAGHVEPYTYPQPLAAFVSSGLQSLNIQTYENVGYHYFQEEIGYRRMGDSLLEMHNTVKNDSTFGRHLPVALVEQALLILGERYIHYPTPQNFGLKDTTLDLHTVFETESSGRSSNKHGYVITFVNQAGDTLKAFGQTDSHNSLGGSTRFPWLLPMYVFWREAQFFTYQPVLWQTLREAMPDSMFMKEYMDNSTLRPEEKLQSGDLLFVSNKWYESDMEQAIKASTGQYSHVALVEVDSLGVVWVIEATPDDGVKHKSFSSFERANDFFMFGSYDIYRLTMPFDTAAVIARAKSFVGQPYDNAFLPNNGALYCSELVYECFLDADGTHLFEAKPMNWRDKEGKLPDYWKKHFEELGIPVPEGVPGTNPTDMSRSPLLRPISQ